ncbi:MAG: cytochrome c3 family protein [Thermodesulfovibrionales bacterium]
MLNRRPGLLAAILVLSWLVFFVPVTDAAAAESCITSQCHSVLLKAKNIHPIAESCDNCHQSVVTPHPQKGRRTFKLLQEPLGLCATCHPPIGQKPHVHTPVKSGMCTSCHNPHASDEPKLLVQPLKELCQTCHNEKMDFKYLHGPNAAGDCTNCHNPHESDNKALVIKDGPELCLTCHFEMQNEMKKKNVHPALLSGCTSCHNPHGAPVKKLLSAEGKNLCFQCHPQIQEKVEKAKVGHRPVNTEQGCASCHSPHASDNEKLLSKTGKDLCLDCHKNVIKKNMTLLHGPINSGTCTPCHDPHGSQETKLLIKSFPADLYVSYSEKEFELCFSCHKRDLLRFPDTSFATGFRDGEKNLHFVHVNKKEKGRSCKVCHNIHGSSGPKLIADKASFGNWELPLKFVKTDTGGQCSPGCHKTYSYDWKTPGKAPEITKPDAGKEKEKGKK